jgi:hypothetical protein
MIVTRPRLAAPHGVPLPRSDSMSSTPLTGCGSLAHPDRENHESFLPREGDVHGLRVSVLDDVC